VDCRPSDALALAARMRAPVMVAEDVMNQAGIVPEEDISDRDATDVEQEHATNFEKEDLDVFEDFLQNFDVDDFDPGEEDED
jgi:uncharacterized protein